MLELGTKMTMDRVRNVEDAIRKVRTAPSVRLLFDYDGTLVPLAPSPELASPDAELLQLLDQLASAPGLSVDLVSGRPRNVLDAWFGQMRVLLWAEHGLWRREAPKGVWEPTASVETVMLEKVIPVLERFALSTPGVHVERKSGSVAWHFRGADAAIAERRADELRRVLADMLADLPLEILEGKKVLEVRFRGSTKAVVARMMDETPASAAIVAFGDDRTDEDLFRALPPASITVAVGEPLDGATHLLDDFREVRQVLRTLLTSGSTGFTG